LGACFKGDVLYLVVDIVEERRFNITCCTAGFYVNASVGDKFRPEKSNAYGGRVHHSIFDLLSELSPHFKKSLAHILKTRAEKHVLERLSIPFQIYQWVGGFKRKISSAFCNHFKSSMIYSVII
jgi:hypothetical protein